MSESRAVREGHPVRVIVLKLTPKLPPEATSIFSVKFTEDQMTVWLGDDNLPVAAERIQRGTAGFMFIKGSMMNRSSWTFAHVVDRRSSSAMIPPTRVRDSDRRARGAMCR